MGLEGINPNNLKIDTPLFKLSATHDEGFKTEGTGSFGEALNKSISNLDGVNKVAASKMEAFSSGQNIEVHDVMLSMEKSGMAMNMAVQVRNRMIDAYNEINRMQL